MADDDTDERSDETPEDGGGVTTRTDDTDDTDGGQGAAADGSAAHDDRSDGDDSDVGTTIEEMAVNLGPCHYDPDEAATLIGKRDDEIGWISVCAEHRDKASEEGYEITEPISPVVTSEDRGDDDADPGDDTFDD